MYADRKTDESRAAAFRVSNRDLRDEHWNGPVWVENVPGKPDAGEPPVWVDADDSRVYVSSHATPADIWAAVASLYDMLGQRAQEEMAMRERELEMNRALTAAGAAS